MDTGAFYVLGIVLVVTLALLAVASFYIFKQLKSIKAGGQKNVETKSITSEEAIQKASEIAKTKLLEAEKEALKITSEANELASKIRNGLKEQEAILESREKGLLERSNNLDQRLDSLDRRQKELESIKDGLGKQRDELARKLEEVAGLNKKEAEELLKKEVEKDLEGWQAKKVRESEDLIKQEADEVSKKILVETMLNSATDYVVETTTTTFTIEDEGLKGKIIGKDGRNIRTFEKLTGVDVIIDEAPNQVTLSSFDPIRREVASLALQKLLQDGRVHPGAIEETIDKVKKDVLKVIKKTGEDIAYETGFNSLPMEIIMLLGRFKYRFSYGQNLVKHTLEMVKIGESLALELGANVEITKLACLLHDLGKVAPEEGKQHHHISAEIAAKYFKDDRLINSIAAHHFDIDAKYMEGEIVRIADAISGARPGARRDSYEEYVKRVRALEDIAMKHKGVKEAFAINAGRQVRVIVKPEETTDEDVKTMAFKIAREIEEQRNYPGVIKVTVIRELRAQGEAK